MNHFDKYIALNASYGNPIIFRLTNRGFFSEIIVFLDAVIYCLLKRRRLIFDDTFFNDQKWNDYFSTSFSSGHAADTSPEWDLNGAGSRNFNVIWRWAIKRKQSILPVWLPQFRFVGSYLQAQRLICSILVQPREVAPVPVGLTRPFAAFHVRRGDKTGGYFVNGHLVIEGEDIPAKKYLEKLDRVAPQIKSIFVMTDDYTIIEDFQTLSGDRGVFTFCLPHERGHQQPAFNSLPPMEKASRNHRLLEETQIAARSDVFIGGFKSNVARFIVLWHAAPGRCFSIDGQLRWSADRDPDTWLKPRGKK